MKSLKRLALLLIAVAVCASIAVYFLIHPIILFHPKDEAMRAGRSVGSFPAADEDYYHDMDGGIALTADEVKGRNTWIVWTGGDDRLWDKLATTSLGTLDFLKTISSRPDAGLKAERKNRWEYLGLVNEPCYTQASGPDPKRYGLWLDKRDSACGPEPFENETKYPGVQVGARGKNMPTGSFYGYATGIVGLRLFPNPDFNEKAAKHWDAERYYKDPSYYNDKSLVRPYRVGMSCGFCHIGPNPVKPPADPENPRWENLSSNVGAQYFWIDRIFAWQSDMSSFPVQLFHASRPGTLDTSLISTDNINNPRSMIPSGPLAQFYHPPDLVQAPRVLKDGADSVGVLGALNRVYLNIGLYSEEWLLHFRPLVGGQQVSPILIKTANEKSVYWNATQQQTPDMALFFLKSTAGHKLKDAPGGDAYLTHDQAQLERGKTVFADRCARCHSSKIPQPAAGLDPNGCSGSGYMDCWNRYWDWTKTDDFKTKMQAIVHQPDFLENNYLSTDQRVPVTLLKTNACSPLATNAIAGNVWDNFSSSTYKELPSAGNITIYQPYTGQASTYALPAGGRGYTRPPSLVSVWSTAPFLLNNSVGNFDSSPSVEGRMRSFQDSIEKMLWPERRDRDSLLPDKLPGSIDRTTEQSFISIPAGFIPPSLRPLLSPGSQLLPAVFGDDSIRIGPIPKGTPVALLSNLDLLGDGVPPAERPARQERVVKLLVKLKLDLAKLPANATDEQAQQVFSNLLPEMLALSKCPDYVVNRGHYFGTSYAPGEPALSDPDKRALIEFLKTF